MDFQPYKTLFYTQFCTHILIYCGEDLVYRHLNKYWAEVATLRLRFAAMVIIFLENNQSHYTTLLRFLINNILLNTTCGNTVWQKLKTFDLL